MTQVVTIDARILTATGLGTYAKDLLENFASTDNEFRFRVLCPEPASMTGFAPERFEFIRATAAIYSLREQWEIGRLARGGDLLHCTHYNVPYLYKGRMVVTIHDLTHLAYREFLPNRLACYYAQFMLKAAARHARQIITVSQFSKKSICEYLDVAEEKVHVIPFALSRRFDRPEPPDLTLLDKLGAKRPYILFVGLLKPHKNVQALLRAFALLPEEIRISHQLVIAGKFDNHYLALREVAQELSLDDRVLFTGYTTDEELRALYFGAKVFVLPSLNEGFGLPALEAMAYGVPVVVSNTSSLPEVVGDAGILVDPMDYRGIADGVQKVLGDQGFWQELSRKSRARAHSFSAKDFALRHLEVYRKALSL